MTNKQTNEHAGFVNARESEQNCISCTGELSSKALSEGWRIQGKPACFKCFKHYIDSVQRGEAQ